MPSAIPLPRRAQLGALLAPDDQAFSESGALIASTLPGTMARAAGMRAGDRLHSVAGQRVRSLCELGAGLRAAGAQQTAQLCYERDGTLRDAFVPTQPSPRHDIPGQLVHYDQLVVDGARLRTITTEPSQRPALATVAVLPGIACESVDVAPDSAIPALVTGWARADIATIRFDKRGVGDSEGGPCSDLDLLTELRDCRAVMGLLMESPGPRYVFGHSVGGMVAAVLASEFAIDGAMLYGTSTTRWLDCVVASTKRQLTMRGMPADQISAHLAALRAKVLDQGLSGRSGAYHRQLDALDLEAAWKSARIDRALVLRGEYDWVVGRAEQARIASIVQEAPESSATLIDLPGLDHLLGWHSSSELSMSEYGAGRFDSFIVGQTLEWMSNHPL